MIKYFLHSLVCIDEVICIDPHDGKSIGLTVPQISPKVILITHNHYDHDAYQIAKGSPLVKIKAMENFSINNYTIFGFKTYHDKEKGRRRGDNVIYKIITPKGKKLVHLGDLGHKLSDELRERLRNPDLLAIPVGGVITINYIEAREIIDELNPKIVLPIHYWINGHYMPLDTIEDFLNVMKGWKIIKIAENKTIEEDSLENKTILII
ncbi:MAG: MBL fold metallo-hydrolase [Sulfolobaceae archaeon]